MIKNWAAEASFEIADVVNEEDGPVDALVLRDIIVKHCPFKPDVAYMPVPRCDRCKYWRLYENPVLDTAGNALGHCVQPNPTWDEELYTRHDFGCVLWEMR